VASLQKSHNLTQKDKGIEYKDMISIAEHKKTLEAKGIHLTDENVGKLLTVQYKLANVFFDIWVKKTTPNVVMGVGVAIHKKNGNCIFVESFSFVYIYA
jgi:hypothetical protein